MATNYGASKDQSPIIQKTYTEQQKERTVKSNIVLLSNGLITSFISVKLSRTPVHVHKPGVSLGQSPAKPWVDVYC